MKVIIAGSRTFNDYKLLLRSAWDFMNNVGSITEIVSGTASGADQLGEQFAEEFNIPVARFPAKWDLYGKSAGYKRNLEMANYADALIAFRVNGSMGTTHMINIAREKKLSGFAIDIKNGKVTTKTIGKV